ncbi:MAG: SOUL family heme-binding protein [Caulobacteraceae bacterium]
MVVDAPHIFAALFATVITTFGVRSTTEEPKYKVVDRVGAVEVRRYDRLIAAEATVPGERVQALNDGFRQVAGYIFGGNTAADQIAMTAPVAQVPQGRQIAMTAPVAQQAIGRAWKIQFYMPAKYTMANLPRPKDERVRLVELQPRTLAVLKFSGSRSSRAVSEQQAQLSAALAGSGWQAVGEAQSWFYDPPWTLPFLRRNEAVVEVRR